MSAKIVDNIPGRDMMDDIPRIASPSFRPTERDIARGACLHSVGLLRDKYRLDGADCNLHFATGRNAERQRWIGCCHNVDCVVLVVDLSSYDVYSASKEGFVNQLADCFELIHSICTKRAFANKPVMLIFNKVDEFAKKVQYGNHISDQEPFNDFTGPLRDAKSGCHYFVRKFRNCLANHDVRDAFMHIACKAETKHVMHFMEDSIRRVKLARRLRQSGFLDCGNHSLILNEDKHSRCATEHPVLGRKSVPDLISVGELSLGSCTSVGGRRSLSSLARSFMARIHLNPNGAIGVRSTGT